MKEVVVVDDERLVLLGIKSYVGLADDRYRVTGAFTSAKEAMVFCRDHPPNILLTDIKMPVVDGLELIRRVKSEVPEIKIVVLSCHDDYTYVHEAFRLGAVDYVLKDQVEEEELVTILDAVAYGGGEPAPHGQVPPAANTWQRLLEALRSNAGRGAEISEDVSEGVSTETQLWHVAAFGFKNAYDGELQPIPWEFDSHILTQSIRDALGALGTAYAAEYRGDKIACIIEVRRDRDSEEERNRAEHILRATCTEISKYWNRTVVATMGRRAVATELLDEAMAATAELQAFAFYEQRGGLLDSKDSNGPAAPPPAAPHFSLSSSKLESSWLEEAEAFFERLVPVDGDERPHPREVKAALAKGLMILCDELRECLGLHLEEIDLTEGTLLKEIDELDDIQILKRYVRNLLQRVTTAIDREHEGSSLVGRTKVYLRENYSRKTSLVTAARHLNVSPAYLSHRFTVETGKTFSQWLNEARIEHAKKLLSTTDRTVKRIAAEVGYESSSYFSRVFNAVTGTYPSDYRRSDLERPTPSEE